jgi:hypothetical protein
LAGGSSRRPTPFGGFAAWWLLSDRLSAEERRLVGTWHVPTETVGSVTMVVTADRRATITLVGSDFGDGPLKHEETGRWAFREGEFILDKEPSLFRRLLRPVGPFIGLRARPVRRQPIEAAHDEVTFIFPNGVRTVWTRVPPE